jgi:D-glycero-alpha-D-manno-heptose-7-phosphate kinase
MRQDSRSIILTRSPVRISFAGGGTDYPDYYENFGYGNVLSATINKFFYTIAGRRTDRTLQIISADKQSFFCADIDNLDAFDPEFKEQFDIPYAVLKEIKLNKGADIFMACEIPPGSGLGSSGSVAVNLVSLFSRLNNVEMTSQQLAEKAFHINSAVLGMPIGKQDEYAAAFGGFNKFIFKKDQVEVKRLEFGSRTKELQNNLMLFFLGYTRSAKDILATQLKRTRRQEPGIIESLEKARDLVKDVEHILAHGDLDELGIVLNQGWEAKKRFADNVSNSLVDKIYSKAISSGAIGGKLTGAGGGGFMLIYCKPENQPAVEKQMQELGVKRLHFEFESEGTRIENDSK